MNLKCLEFKEICEGSVFDYLISIPIRLLFLPVVVLIAAFAVLLGSLEWTGDEAK